MESSRSRKVVIAQNSLNWLMIWKKKMKDAAENTSLPDCPDTEAAYEMLVEMNKNHILKMEDYYDRSTY